MYKYIYICIYESILLTGQKHACQTLVSMLEHAGSLQPFRHGLWSSLQTFHDLVIAKTTSDANLGSSKGHMKRQGVSRNSPSNNFGSPQGLE